MADSLVENKRNVSINLCRETFRFGKNFTEIFVLQYLIFLDMVVFQLEVIVMKFDFVFIFIGHFVISSYPIG